MKRTISIGISNSNTPNIYREYNSVDHLFPYEQKKLSNNISNIKLKLSLESFNSLVTHTLNVEEYKNTMQLEEINKFKNIVDIDSALFGAILSNSNSKELKIELEDNGRQIYVCRHFIVELNENICKLKDITVIQACCNYINYLPFGIGQLKNLKILVISRNRIKEIPEEIGFCTELREIDVSNNLLKKLPKSIVALKKLHTFHMANNKFTELPTFIGKLSSLKYINVSGNKIKNIPFELFKLPFLLSLNADNCNFERIKKFEKVGELTLKEILSRRIIRNNMNINKEVIPIIKDYLLDVKECAFCGGPYFNSYIEVNDFQVFESEVYPIRYKMCCKHYNDHDNRLLTLFEKSMSTAPTKLITDGLPSVTELFEPFSFDEIQLRKMNEINSDRRKEIPLIGLAIYRSYFFKRFTFEKNFIQDVQGIDVFERENFNN